MEKTLLFTCLIGISLILVGFLYSSVYALDQNGMITVPFSAKIAVIDGEWTTTEEWEDASITNLLHKDRKVVLLMKHDGEYQYIMFDALYDVTPKKQGFTSRHLATILIDTENDGGTVMQKDDFRFTFGIMYDEQGEIISTPMGFLNQISIGDPNSEKGYSSMPEPSGFKHNISFSSKNDPYESAKHYIHEFKIPLSFFDNVDSFGFSAFYDGTVGDAEFIYPKFPDKLIPREPNEWASIFFNSASIQIPTWIKDNAKWWSEGAIGDSDFTSGIQFMIKENIIYIPDLPEQEIISTKNLKLNAKEFTLPKNRYEATEVVIKGIIDDYARGVPVYVKIENPDGEVHEQMVIAADGHYMVIYAIHHDFTLGKYYVSTKYFDQVVDETTFILSENVAQVGFGTPKDLYIPPWVKNNAGWWADGQISEDDFVNGIKYLVKKGIIKV